MGAEIYVILCTYWWMGDIIFWRFSCPCSGLMLTLLSLATVELSDPTKVVCDCYLLRGCLSRKGLSGI